MKQYLNQLLKSEESDNQSLTKEQAYEAQLKIGRGEVNPSQIAAFLTAIQMKGITVEELEGFRAAMLELAVPINLAEFDAMDIVGTGGDGKDTFNISTTSALVVAGAGQNIAKHGNHGVSSAVGASTVLEYLGVKFTNDESHLKQKLETAGMCYMHAPLFHPAMKYVAPIRKELGIKTYFNILGPLLSPARVQKQFSGVYNEKVFELYSQLFQRTKGKYAIVFDKAGYDEISMTGSEILLQKNNSILFEGKIREEIFSPEELYGGSSTEESAKILVNILENRATNAQKQVVLTNAGVALSVAKSISFEEGIAQAKESIESGKALNCLKKLTEK